METQIELFTGFSVPPTKLLATLANLVLGTEREQREAIDTLVDLVEQDINVARRMVRILDANQPMISRHPEFYRRAVSASGRD